MDPQTELLLRKSALDEGVLLDNVDDLIFGFHAQQAIEKPLKALLAQLGRQYPRTHDLERLAFLLGNAGESLPPTPALLTDLNDYAVEYRYDEPLLPLNLDRNKVKTTVRILREFVYRRVQELNAQTQP